MQFDQSGRLRSAIIVFIVCLTMAACAPTRSNQLDNSPLAKQAVTEELRGDYAGAATSWERLSTQLDGDDEDRALVRAAIAYQRAGQTREASRVVSQIENLPDGKEGIDFRLLAAELALDEGDPEAAIRAIEGLPGDLDGENKATALGIESDARFQMGQVGEGVTAGVHMAAYLVSAQSVDNNRRRIWNRLQESAAAGADMTTPKDANQVVAGWMELGRILKANGRNRFELKASLSDWRDNNPLHPASRSVIDGVLTGYTDLEAVPRKIALILPLSGRLKSSAAAVRDGFMAAYFEQGASDSRPSVMVLDTAALGPVGAWERAARDGADFIVGPLLKEEVEKLTTVSGGVTTLALNEPVDPDALPKEVYQFALSPEDEAKQVASRVLSEGFYRGLAFVPANDWGMRIAESFGEALQAEGGRLVELATYTPGQADHSEIITRALRVDQSKSRNSKVEQALGVSLKFEPRRRRDVDFVFVAALPRDGRLLKPQLRFHRAADIPVFATSAIFETRSGGNRDLDGLTFDDMPWILEQDETTEQLRQKVRSTWPTLGTRRSRLFALGFDAYQLVPLISADRSTLDRGIDGMTGLLTLQDGRRIQRELKWATVVRGEPSVRETAIAP
ncbi:MAG: penicillin-binding protein activator [Gammaproteobacteria bacterium]